MEFKEGQSIYSTTFLWKFYLKKFQIRIYNIKSKIYYMILKVYKVIKLAFCGTEKSDVLEQYFSK